jgi:ABC-2 type transport system ATP-binding protein
MMIPLEATDLSKRYGRAWALRDTTLTIPEGSISALIGPNGAGKSTFLRLAAGLTSPSKGSISIFGHDPRHEADRVLPRIGFVAQDRPLYPRLTVGEMCTVGVRLNKRWDRAYAESRLERLGIDRRKKAGKLSGGQQAQLALVLALAKHPEFILLDEPTASLDPDTADWVRAKLIDYKNRRGATILLASHNMTEVERMADRVLMMKQGQVVEDASPTELLGRYGRSHLEDVFLDIARGRRSNGSAGGEAELRAGE